MIYNPAYTYKFQLKTTFFNSDGSGFPIFFLGIVGCRPLTNFSGRRTIWWIHNNTCFVQPSIAIFLCRVGNTDQIWIYLSNQKQTEGFLGSFWGTCHHINVWFWNCLRSWNLCFLLIFSWNKAVTEFCILGQVQAIKVPYIKRDKASKAQQEWFVFF